MTRRIVVLAIALVLALLGAIGVIAYAGAADERALAGQEPVKVFIATGAIPAGTSLATAREVGLIGNDVVPKRSTPARALRSLPEGDDLVAVTDIAPGEVLLDGRFGSETVDPTTLVVPKGKLAMSVQLADPARVGGFVKPGDEVVILHYRELGETRTATVLMPRVEVLAVGATTQGVVRQQQQSGAEADTAEEDSGEADGAAQEKQVPVSIVTVAVAPADMTRLSYASNVGVLQLALLGEGATAVPGQRNDQTVYR